MFKKTFYILLLRNDPRTSSLTTLCITHCCNLSICLLLLICLYSSPIMFLNFRFVPKQLYCLFLIIVQSSSMFLVSFSCFSVFFLLICRSSFYTFIEHVFSPRHTVFYCLFCLYFVKWVSGFNCKVIND